MLLLPPASTLLLPHLTQDQRPAGGPVPMALPPAFGPHCLLPREAPCLGPGPRTSAGVSVWTGSPVGAGLFRKTSFVLFLFSCDLCLPCFWLRRPQQDLCFVGTSKSRPRHCSLSLSLTSPRCYLLCFLDLLSLCFSQLLSGAQPKDSRLLLWSQPSKLYICFSGFSDGTQQGLKHTF